MLVEAHAKVGNTVPSSASGLVNRVLVALVTKVTEVALRCFQQVPKYGTGGMLTVSPFLPHFPHSRSTLPSIYSRLLRDMTVLHYL
jgi:hypothetical protein